MKKGPESRRAFFLLNQQSSAFAKTRRESPDYWGDVGLVVGADGLGADGTGVALAAGAVGAGTPDFTL